MEETFFLICGSTFFFGTLALIFFSFFAFIRYVRYRETLTLAEKGLVHPRLAGNGKGTLRWGLVITGFGLALCVGLYPNGFVANAGFPLHFGPWMLAGLLPTFFGLSLLAIYLLTSKESPNADSAQAEPSVILGQEEEMYLDEDAIADDESDE